jgi:hypothetical protein
MMGVAPMISPAHRLVLPLALACVGCRGGAATAGHDGATSGDASTTTASAADTDDDPAAPACAVEPRDPVRRLSAFEYARALDDLLGVTIDEARLPASSTTPIFATDDAALASSPVLVDGQFDATVLAAEAVLARLDADGAQAFVGCDPTDGSCIDAWLGELGRRAHRRPLDDDVRARLHGLFDEIAAVDGIDVAIAGTVQAMLLSPRFGFHVEEAAPDGGPDDWAIASRLSFLLWGSIPDDALLDAAKRGELQDPEARREHARRMLDDPRAASRVVRTWRELLDIDALASAAPIDPRFTATLRDEMFAEFDAFISTTALTQGGTLADVLTSRWVDAGPELAALYGSEADALPPERVGVLGRAAFLAATARGDAPSPILRGLAVLDRLACTAIAPPPPSVPAIPEIDADGTNRQRFEQHTADPACAGCHRQFDPIGFTLEHFDAIGAYRTQDGGLPIDAHGSVLGIEVDGAVELATTLAEHDVVWACAVTQQLRAAIGHAPRTGEACVRDALATSFLAGDGDLAELLVEIAASEVMIR